MAGRPSLNARSLEALGAARLAELLLEHTQGNEAARRALRLAVAVVDVRGPAEMGQQVRQRLVAIHRSKRWVDRRQLPVLLADLETQRLAIVGPIAPQEPQLALDLLWRFLDLANPLLGRVGDCDGQALALFHRVSADLGRVAIEARVNPTALANQVAKALLDNRHGQHDLLVRHLVGALQPQGLRWLRQRLEAERPPPEDDEERLQENDAEESEAEGVMVKEVCPYFDLWLLQAVDFEADCEGAAVIENDDEESEVAVDVWEGQEPLGTDPAVALEEDEEWAEDVDFDCQDGSDLVIELIVPGGDENDQDDDRRSALSRRRIQTVRQAMLAIADGLGDAEAFLAEYREHRPSALRLPRIAARVAMRLTAAGQAEQALLQLDRAVLEQGLQSDGARLWIDARLEALEALGRQEEAQRLRNRFALERLSLPHLRTYLQRLPVFEAGEAREQALDAVLRHRDFNRALEFLHCWLDHRRAARLILERPSRLDGRNEALLRPLVPILEDKGQLLAASLCLRAMLESILHGARSSHYSDGVGYLERCVQLAPSIHDWGKTDPHNRWVVNLSRRFSHRDAFFKMVKFSVQLPELEPGG